MAVPTGWLWWLHHNQIYDWPWVKPRQTPSFFNKLRPRQNGRHFPDNTFKRIFLNENIRILIKISLKFVPKGPINNIPALVQIMAWSRPGDKPLSEPMMVSLPTHICVTRPQWVNAKHTRWALPVHRSSYTIWDRVGRVQETHCYMRVMPWVTQYQGDASHCLRVKICHQVRRKPCTIVSWLADRVYDKTAAMEFGLAK